MTDTFEEFMRRYGRADRRDPVIDVGDTVDQWPTVVVRFGDRTAVLQFCGTATAATTAATATATATGSGDSGDSGDSQTDGGGRHLSIDIHAFVAGRLARSAVFGMEQGRRYTSFDDTAPGTSHGWPAVQGITVLIVPRPPAPRTAEPASRRVMARLTAAIRP